MAWYVLYVKPQSEKKAVQQLTNIGLDVYCPMVTEIHQWSDRKKKVEVPLIKSYVFVNIEQHEYQDVFQAHSVVRYLYWLKKPAIVRDQEIDVMKEWLNGKMLSIKTETLKAGDNYIVDKGVFKGQEGVVNEVNTNRVQLVLEPLGIKITITK